MCAVSLSFMFREDNEAFALLHFSDELLGAMVLRISSMELLRSFQRNMVHAVVKFNSVLSIIATFLFEFCKPDRRLPGMYLCS